MKKLLALALVLALTACNPMGSDDTEEKNVSEVSSSTEVSSSSQIPVSSSETVSSSSQYIPVSSSAQTYNTEFTRYYDYMETYYLAGYIETQCYSNNATVTANAANSTNMVIKGSFICYPYSCSEFTVNLNSVITNIVGGNSGVTVDGYTYKMFQGIENGDELINIQWFGEYSALGTGDFRFWYQDCDVRGDYFCYNDPTNGVMRLNFHFRE